MGSKLVDRYCRTRARTRQIFDLIADSAYYVQPIALRHPIVFYEGHLPAFSFNVLVKKALGAASIDPRLEHLFARGIDPHESAAAEGVPPEKTGSARGWPDRDEVRAFVEQADRLVIEALERDDLDRPGDPLLDHAEAVFTILEHEAMHQETLLYMWHRLPQDLKKAPPGYRPLIVGREPVREWVEIPAGTTALGVDRRDIPFGWDNEHPACAAHVPAFAIERHDVTNARFLEFVEDKGYRDDRWWSTEDAAWLRQAGIEHPLFWERDGQAWYWRGMFERLALPLSWPVYVSLAEASAFARWSGARLPTEPEFQRAAYGSPGGPRPYPWGAAPPTRERGVFDFDGWDPQPVGSHPAGASAWGVEDLVGNGWEWTSTPFAPFPGFRPMASYPEYSADFFDGQHFVVKGASHATASELIRPTFRNWFRARYPYVYATFRSVRVANAR